MISKSYLSALFQQRFDCVLAKVMTPVVPKLITNAYDNIYEVTQVGYGDNARYKVKSNELFIGATCC